ncbi:glycine cleavage system aminomethyltransferase GcvT, partial [Candidatus Woesearchaeota archaeon]|nr:glycine cleavage system aminomethyltransferase GcvT [Candidatus Woesearchaeota archaeon]
PLYDEHVKLHGQIVEFGGWLMPVQYTNVIDEHTTIRTKVGLFDTCHMGEFFVSGRDAFRLIQLIGTNDIARLEDGKSMYHIWCYENGTTIDDSFVYKFKDNNYLIVVNASTIQKDFDWLKFQATKNDLAVELVDASDDTAKIDIQGPFAEKTLQKLTKLDLASLKRFYFSSTKLVTSTKEEIDCIISRSGYTGEDGFELYFAAEKAPLVWNLLLAAGKEFEIKPCGLGARDTLRLEACYSLYGHEIDESITPVEGGLGWAVKENKECKDDKGNKIDFVGKQILSDQKKNGPKRIIAALEMIDKSVPRNSYEIFDEDKTKKIGYVTSGTFCPTLKRSVAMGLVDFSYSKIDTVVTVKIRDNFFCAKVVKRPFYEFRGGKK